MDARKQFIKNMTAVHGAQGPRAAASRKGNGVINVRRAELLARANAFLGKNYDAAKLDSIELIQKQFAMEQARLYKQFLSERPSAVKYVSDVNALVTKSFSEIENVLGKEDFVKFVGVPREQLSGLVDLATFEAANAAKSSALHEGGKRPPAHKVVLKHHEKIASSTVTLKQIAAEIAAKHEISKKKSEAILSDVVGHILKNLKKGVRVRMVGLGILHVRRSAARTGRNPATGEQIRIKASKKVRFRAAKNAIKAA